MFILYHYTFCMYTRWNPQQSKIITYDDMRCAHPFLIYAYKLHPKTIYIYKNSAAFVVNWYDAPNDIETSSQAGAARAKKNTNKPSLLFGVILVAVAAAAALHYEEVRQFLFSNTYAPAAYTHCKWQKVVIKSVRLLQMYAAAAAHQILVARFVCERNYRESRVVRCGGIHPLRYGAKERDFY